MGQRMTCGERIKRSREKGRTLKNLVSLGAEDYMIEGNIEDSKRIIFLMT